MKPAAPVTRIRTASSYAVTLLRFLQSLRASSISLRWPWSSCGAIEVRQRLVAAPELGEGQTEVVLGVRLVGLAAACEGGDRLARDPLCARPVPRLEQARRLVGERHAVCRWRWRWRRRWRRRRWRRRLTSQEAAPARSASAVAVPVPRSVRIAARPAPAIAAAAMNATTSGIEDAPANGRQPARRHGAAVERFAQRLDELRRGRRTALPAPWRVRAGRPGRAGRRPTGPRRGRARPPRRWRCPTRRDAFR